MTVFAANNGTNVVGFKGLTLLAVSQALLSQTVAAHTLEEGDLFSDIPVVVTATRMPQSVDKAPLSITVLDRELIDASGFVEIPDLFRLVPGFQVGLSWRDHHTAVTYHGQSDGLDRRLQVLIDGKVALSTLFGLVDWDRLGITVDDIERIEVMRGPSGVYYGSNAFSGAINIVTRDALTESGLRLSVTSGSRDTRIVSASYSEAGEKFDYRVNASYFNTEGFKGVNDESESRALRLKGRYQLTADALLEFQLGAASGPWGRGGTGLAIDPIDEKEADEKYGTLRFTRTLSPGNEWYIQGEVSVSEEDDEYPIGLLSELLSLPAELVPAYFAGQPDQLIRGNTFDYISQRQDLEFQQMLTLSDNRRGIWGLGYRKDTAEGIATVGTTDKKEIETYRAYGSIEFGLSDRVLMNAGLMYEDTDINKGKLSSRVGANIALAENHVLRIAVAKSYRHPFVAEAFHDVAARFEDNSVLEQTSFTPEILTPEEILSYELGYMGHWLDDALRIDVKLFKEKTENEVEYVLNPVHPEPLSVFNPGAVYDLNSGATDVAGVEGNINWLLTEKTRLWASYSYAEADQDCSPGLYSEVASGQFPGAFPGLVPEMFPQAFRCLDGFHDNDATPRHTASALLLHNFGQNWQVSLSYYYLDEMAWILWGGDTESYSRVDARLAKTFTLDSADLTVELIAQNLGSDYKEFNDLNTFKTRGFVRATVQFH